MSEDAFFDAEFDRIRENESNLTPATTVHSLPYAAPNTAPLPQPGSSSVGPAQQQLGNLRLHQSDNTNRTHRQAPPIPTSTSRPRVDPFQSAPFPLAPKNN